MDASVVWRKILAFAPRWVRFALATSFVVGECLQTIAKLFAPSLQAWNAIDTTSFAQHEWLLIGISITMPVAFLWHTFRYFFRGTTPFERAEEYIAILKMGVDNAALSPTQQRIF